MKKLISIAILAMGFSGLVAEILLLRELLIVFSGNELCIGIILANWLVLEAIGCFSIGKIAEKSKHALETFTVITILFSISLPISIYLTRILKNIIGISIGESMGFLPMFYSSFLILSLVSILHGTLFTFSCHIYSTYSDRDSSSAGRVYIYETVGTFIGGIFCTYLFIPHLHSLQVSLGLALLNITLCIVLLIPSRKRGLFHKTILVILGILVFFSGYLFFSGKSDKLHHYSIKRQWKNLDIVHYQNSHYGNICVVENQGQYIFFLDGIPNITIPVPDIQFTEEFVHLPLLAHPEPEKLLILSGGAGGMIHEAFKHSSVEKIEYAELDPLLLDLIRKFSTPVTESELNDRRVKIEQMDGCLFLKLTQNTYDLIFIGIMEPSNLQANRFFTKEFFSLVKKRLNKDGILVLGLPGSLMYVNEELKNLNSCIFHTLKSVFSSTRVIPGDGKNIYLSSDSHNNLMIDEKLVAERIYQRNIKANVIVPWHIENKLHDGWQDWFSHFIEGSSQKINSDLKPVGLYYSISHWNALFAPSFGWIFKKFESIKLRTIALLCVIFLIVYAFFRSKNTKLFRTGITISIFTTGFAGMIFDLLLIFTFQAIYGYVFSWIGLLVAAFMIGSAFGAMAITRILPRLKNHFNIFKKIDLTIICFTFGLPFLFLVVYSYMSDPGTIFFSKMFFLIISCFCGLLIGAQFPLANVIYLKNNRNLSKTAGMLYSSDLLGGWFGGLIGAVVLLPVLGLTGTCITVGLLKLTTFIVLITQPNQHL